MAVPLTAAKLLSVLRAEGVSAVEVGSWRTHNRGSRGTGWGPVNGVMLHHSVTGDGSAGIGLVRSGHSALPGPLYHGAVDKAGRLHLVGHGRANHAGGGDPAVLAGVIREAASLPPPRSTAQDGNSRFYGLAALNLGDGKDPWPAAQLECVARAAAAICRAHGWNQYSVIGHAEWQPGKIDPRGPGKNATAMMRDFRAEIGRLLAAPAGRPAAPAPPPPPKEQSVNLTRDQLTAIAHAVWTRDGIIRNPGPNAEANTHIAGGTGLRNIEIIVRRMEQRLAAQDVVLGQLAAALAARDDAIDVDALVSRIHAELASVTIRLTTED